MKKSQKLDINGTLNNILLQIFSGIDYATKIALKTKKSVPVVYRQLDMLVEFGILTKERAGKKVAYVINWIHLSDIVSSTLFLDIEKLRILTKAHEKETKIIAELKILMGELPAELFTDKQALKKLVKEFFTQEEVRKMMTDFFREIDLIKNEHIDYNKLSFEGTINLFIDTFGMLDRDQQHRKLLKKLDSKNERIAQFLTYCRIRYLQKQLYDPRNKFLNQMNEV